MPLMDDPRRRQLGTMGGPMTGEAGIAGPTGWGTMDAVPSTNMARPTDIAGAGMAGGNMAFPQPPPSTNFRDTGMPGGSLGMRGGGGQFGGEMMGVAGPPSSIASQFSQVPPVGGPGNIAQRLRRGGYTGMGRGGYTGMGRGGVARNPNMVGTAVRRPGRDRTRRF